MPSTLESLRKRAKYRADMEESHFVEESEWNQYISDSYSFFYDKLVGKFVDWYVEDPLSFSLASGESTKEMPSNFYKLLGVDRKISGDEYYPLRPFSFNRRNRRRSADVHRGLYPSIEYRLLGSKLRFTPKDQAAGDYRIWFIPRASVLSDDTDEIDDVNGWDEWIVLDAARKALLKEESDITSVAFELKQLDERIEEMAQVRDAGETDVIQDVTHMGYDDPLFYR